MSREAAKLWCSWRNATILTPAGSVSITSPRRLPTKSRLRSAISSSCMLVLATSIFGFRIMKVMYSARIGPATPNG